MSLSNTGISPVGKIPERCCDLTQSRRRSDHRCLCEGAPRSRERGQRCVVYSGRICSACEPMSRFTISLLVLCVVLLLVCGLLTFLLLSKPRFVTVAGT